MRGLDPGLDPRIHLLGKDRAVAPLKSTLIAFRTNLDAGHVGAAGRFDRLREVALAYAFAIKVAGAAL